MPTRVELKDLAQTRLKEARVLYRNRFYDGSIYLAGYVVELALKARICKMLDLRVYPDSGEISRSFKTHNLDDLLRLSGLQNKFDVAISRSPTLLANWSVVTNWSEQFRYHPVGTSSQAQAQEVLAALDDPRDGVLTWLKKYW